MANPEQKIVADAKVLCIDDDWFLDISVDGESRWRSSPYDTETEARALIESLEEILKKIPGARKLPPAPTGIQ